MKRVLGVVLAILGGAGAVWGHTAEGSSVWSMVLAPAMDPAKSAVTENVEIVRDRVHIILVSGNIQFAKPANGMVFAAVFHGNGRVQLDPPNPTEAQQLRLFTKADRLNAEFTDATFTFSDGLLEEVGKQVKWKDGGSSDDLYGKRQQEREDLGGEYLPRIFKALMSPSPTLSAAVLPR